MEKKEQCEFCGEWFNVGEVLDNGICSMCNDIVLAHEATLPELNGTPIK